MGKAATVAVTCGVFAMLFRLSDGIGLFQAFCAVGVLWILWEVAFPRQTNDLYTPDIRRQARRMMKEEENEIIEEIKKRRAVK